MSDRKNINSINRNVEDELFGTEEKNRPKNDQTLIRLENSLSRIKQRSTKDSSTNTMDVLSAVITNYKMNNIDKVKKKVGIGDKAEMNELFQSLVPPESFDQTEGERYSRYDDYRIIYEYIPEVATAIDALAESIMSPDNIDENTINYLYGDKALTSEDNSIKNKLSELKTNMEILIKKYDLNTFVATTIKDSLLLGDDFTLVTGLAEQMNMMLNEDDQLSESGNTINEQMLSDLNEDLTSMYTDMKSKELLSEEVTSAESFIKNIKKNAVDAINNNVKFIKDPLKMLSDNKNIDGKERSKINIDMAGAYFKHFKPEDMIKLEVDSHCIGYLYIDRSVKQTKSNNSGSLMGALTSITSPDFGSATNNKGNSNKNGINSIGTNDASLFKNGNTALEYQAITDLLVKGISKKIDKQFIEKNKEFKDLIFTLVRRDYIVDKQIAITFLEPEMVSHLKLDSSATYGVSKLRKSLFPSKMYLMSTIISMMVKINQGRDKRVYYVDVDMDDDFEGIIQSLIKDLKSKEIPSDLLGNGKSIGTMMGTVGALDNFYIPRVDGSAPLDMDTIAGIQVDVDDAMLDRLLKSAVIGTGVPYNYIDASNDVDFARTLSMQNKSFVEKVIVYQRLYSEYFTSIIQKLYKYEFFDKEEMEKKGNIKNEADTSSVDEEEEVPNIDYREIKIKFPAPTFLSIANDNEQIENITTTINFITDMYYDEGRDETDRRKFKRNLAREIYLPNMDWDKFEQIYETTKRQKVDDKLTKQMIKPPTDGDVAEQEFGETEVDDQEQW